VTAVVALGERHVDGDDAVAVFDGPLGDSSAESTGSPSDEKNRKVSRVGHVAKTLVGWIVETLVETLVIGRIPTGPRSSVSNLAVGHFQPAG
jgi:hypothetical protein